MSNTNPHEPDPPFVTRKALAVLTAGTVAFALASLPFSGRIEAVMVAAAAFLAMGALLIFASLVGDALVDRIAGWLSR